MLILGIALLVAGVLLGLHILYIVGIILAIVGGALLVVEATSGRRALNGRRWY